MLSALVEKAIERLVNHFFEYPNAFRTEQSMHCHLYHLLAEEGLDEVHPSGMGYMVGQLQKEYPPVVADRAGPRGRFDIVVLDRESIGAIGRWDYRLPDGTPVPPHVAVELKLNGGLRWNPEGAHLSDIRKELFRLGRQENGVKIPYLLYFYRVAYYETRRGQINSLEKLTREFIRVAGGNPRVTSFLVSVTISPENHHRTMSSKVTRVASGRTTIQTRSATDRRHDTR